jgi:hypothetical protein
MRSTLSLSHNDNRRISVVLLYLFVCILLRVHILMMRARTILSRAHVTNDKSLVILVKKVQNLNFLCPYMET